MFSSITFVQFLRWGGVSIGSNCIFGEGVKIYDNNHTFNQKKNIKDSGYHVGRIEIGDDCWIANNCVILKGTKIGNHCVIGAGCVISGEIPDNSLVRHNNDYKIECIERLR